MNNIPQEQSAEVNGNKKPENKPGVYVHQNGTKIIALNTQQADAIVRVGFEWARDMKESDMYVPSVTSPVEDAKAEIAKMLADAKEAAAKIIADAQAETKTKGE